MSYIQRFLRWTDLWSRNPSCTVYVKWMTCEPGRTQNSLYYVHAAQTKKKKKKILKNTVKMVLPCHALLCELLGFFALMFVSLTLPLCTHSLICSSNWKNCITLTCTKPSTALDVMTRSYQHITALSNMGKKLINCNYFIVYEQFRSFIKTKQLLNPASPVYWFSL